jgi:hypothetical protein
MPLAVHLATTVAGLTMALTLGSMGLSPPVAGAAPRVAAKAKPERFDWLDVRRGGYAGLLAAGRAAQAQRAWSAKWTLPKGQVAGLDAIVVTRRPDLPAKGKQPAGYQLTVRFVGQGHWQGSGVAVVGKDIWLRMPGSQVATRATPAELFATIPGLDLPMAIFVLSEVAQWFDGQMEGEFGSVGVLRLRPKYTLGDGLLPCKLGISKQSGAFAAAELVPSETQPPGGIQWLDEGLLTPTSPQVGFARLRIVPGSNKTRPFLADRTSAVVGAEAMKLPFGKAALK